MSMTKLEKKEYHKLYYQLHKDDLKKKSKGYYISNKEDCLQKSKIYQSEHKEELKEKKKKYYDENKEYFKELSTLYYKEHKDNVADYKLKKKYGITLEEKNKMYKNQDGKCLICGERETLRVDHNHITGKVRGLLCDRCNLILGHANDDENILYEAIDYLRRNK